MLTIKNCLNFFCCFVFSAIQQKSKFRVFVYTTRTSFCNQFQSRIENLRAAKNLKDTTLWFYTQSIFSKKNFFHKKKISSPSHIFCPVNLKVSNSKFLREKSEKWKTRQNLIWNRVFYQTWTWTGGRVGGLHIWEHISLKSWWKYFKK